MLDLGAGTGTLSYGYAAQGCFVCAVDVSAEMLAQAEGPFVKIVSRAEDCAFASETFDHVVVGQAWHWFDGERVAADCWRILKPGGRMQACNGVMAIPSKEFRSQFDEDLERLLSRESEPSRLPHRVAWVVGDKPR